MLLILRSVCCKKTTLKASLNVFERSMGGDGMFTKGMGSKSQREEF